jgi:hypothetical protein
MQRGASLWAVSLTTDLPCPNDRQGALSATTGA